MTHNKLTKSKDDSSKANTGSIDQFEQINKRDKDFRGLVSALSVTSAK